MKYFSPKKWKDTEIKFKEKGNKYKKINRKNKKGLKKLISNLFLIFLLLFFVGGTVGAGYYTWLMKKLPTPDKIINRQIEQTTKIYDRTGEKLLYEFHGDQSRVILELDEMSPYVEYATLAAEDRGFYEHHGFDFKGFIRSILQNLLTGSKVGGSTITQQFVKNAVLTPEKTYTRKIKELIIAYQLENKFSKDEILKMYLNEIPYGSVVYGIESAANRYFGKTAKDLTVAEAAMLASIPKATTYYNPFGSHRDDLEARYKYVIDAMADEGYITDAEKEVAKKEDVFSKLQEKAAAILAPHFVFYVKEYLSEVLGEQVVEQGGLKVITSLDLDMQELAERAITDKKDLINSFNATNASLVALNPKTGEVLAMVGSLDYYDKDIDGNVNVALRSRQPGSSFKPIVYATAFSRGYTPNTILFDVETTHPTIIEEDGYTPKNYDLGEHGPVSVRKALAGSLNIPAVKMLYLAGVDSVLNLADLLGYTTLKDRSRFGLSLVLGGGEVKLLEHVGAYAAFANDGQRAEVVPVLKVLDSKGRTIYEEKIKIKKALDEEVARQINDILSDNAAREYVFGANNYLNVGFSAAAKTGTTNDYCDAWTIGYTPELAVGVWVGNNNNHEMKEGAAGGVVAAPIWNQFIKQAVKDKTAEFVKPKAVITGKPILDGEEIPGSIVKIDKYSGKLATDFTPESFVIEKTYKEVHNILYYVDKDNPRGPAPSDPTKDPYYNAWEDAVRVWAEKNNFVSELPPNGYDDIHIPANKPQISITSPENNNSVDRTFTVSVKTLAPRGVSRVLYYIDDSLLYTSNTYPFYGILSLPSGIGSGFHRLKAVSYDDIDNSNSHEININITSGAGSSNEFVWISPQNNFVISSFPINVTFNMPRSENVSLWYKKSDNADYYKIGEKQDPNGYTSIPWSGSGISSGTYTIKAVITDGSDVKEKEMTVVVQ
ncbi:transglycosylase domain-containing protein [Candidatus Parcubacteria bacterium]|nr:transglycosylase domain-containing protein [Patescibacteria group bacterium]MCG2693958.1 transglycosylase domain-containing protein [Candidatus Parcubacteria bacterium]